MAELPLSELLFDYLNEMEELQVRIKAKGSVEIGNPDVARYQALRSEVATYMPQTKDTFVNLLEYVHHHHLKYKRWLERKVETVREESQRELDDATTRLRGIAQAVQPYLKKDNP